jgi:DNA (cytosine-5)-methyltransferase 1
LPASLVPKKSPKIPKCKSPSKVPVEFLELIGEHSAHPGTGKGYGAERFSSSSVESNS